MLKSEKGKKIDKSLGVTELKVEELIQLAEGDNLNMDAIFTTPDIISKLIPIAQVGLNRVFIQNKILYHI